MVIVRVGGSGRGCDFITNCDLIHIICNNYTHISLTLYSPPPPPSPPIQVVAWLRDVYATLTTLTYRQLTSTTSLSLPRIFDSHLPPL